MACFKENCRLCLSDLINDDFEIITNTTIGILKTLTVKLDLGEGESHAICSVCSSKLLSTFDFMTLCTYTDSLILTHIESERQPQIDLRDIYLKERNSKHAVVLSKDGKICRLCMNLIGNTFVALEEMDMDTLSKFLPKLNLQIVKDAVVCNSCFESFAIHSEFLKTCLMVQEVIKNSKNDCEEYIPLLEEPIKTEEVDIKFQDKFSLNSCMGIDEIKTDIDEDQPLIVKTELIKIELEDDQDSGIPPTVDTYTGPQAHEIKHSKTIVKLSNYKVKKKNRPSTHDSFERTNGCFEVRMYKCDSCAHETEYRGNLKTHQLTHKQYKCDVCDYSGTLVVMKRHRLTHKEVKIYTCDRCGYETKVQGSLKKHLLIHKDPSEVQMHQCDVCGYQTKHKNHLKSHQLIHNRPPQVQVYSCDVCDFKTRIKGNLRRHLLFHKYPSQVQKYKCADCGYATILQSNLRNHQLKHKDPSRVKVIHKCDICHFETIFKNSLGRHVFMRHREIL